MSKILLATAALGAVAAMPAAPASASHRTPLYSHPRPLYCIPPANARATAQAQVSATARLLTPYKPAGLGALHSITPTAGASAPGRIALTITARVHHAQITVGKGSERVKGAGCFQLNIKLTGAGRKLLERSTSITLDIVGAFSPKKGSRAVAKTSVTLS
jgi:hypothetical protein